MNLLCYESIVRMRSISFAGRIEAYTWFDNPADGMGFQSPIVQAWLDDDDLQELIVTSTNFGFTRTYRKFYGGTVVPNEGESTLDAFYRHAREFQSHQPMAERYHVLDSMDA